MSAARALLDELQQAGIRLSARGDKLGIEAPKGLLTDQLRSRIAEHKPGLLVLVAANDDALASTRERLLRLADEACLASTLVEALSPADIAACEGRADAALQTFLGSLERQRRIAACQRPPEYTLPAMCAGCGPVWLWDGAPLEVTACPWCPAHTAGRDIPRPPVACRACVHFQPDPINPRDGIGTCGIGTKQRAPMYPALPRTCSKWGPLAEGVRE